MYRESFAVIRNTGMFKSVLVCNFPLETLLATT